MAIDKSNWKRYYCSECFSTYVGVPEIYCFFCRGDLIEMDIGDIIKIHYKNSKTQDILIKGIEKRGIVGLIENNDELFIALWDEIKYITIIDKKNIVFRIGDTNDTEQGTCRNNGRDG